MSRIRDWERKRAGDNETENNIASVYKTMTKTLATTINLNKNKNEMVHTQQHTKNNQNILAHDTISLWIDISSEEAERKMQKKRCASEPNRNI